MDNRLQGKILKHNKLSIQYLKSQNYKQSFQHLKKAQQILQQHKSSPQWLRLLGITLNNIACYYKSRKQFKVALNYLKKAFKVQLKAEQDPSSISGTLINISALYSSLQNHTDALTYAQKAIKLLQNNQTPQFQSRFISLAISYYNAGVQLQHLNRLAQASKFFQKGIQIAENIQQKNTPIISSLRKAFEQLKIRVGNIQDMRDARVQWRELNRVSPHTVRKPPVLVKRVKPLSQVGPRTRRGNRALRSSLPPLQQTSIPESLQKLNLYTK